MFSEAACPQGTKRIKYLEENVAAFQIKLTAEDLIELDALSSAAAGDRYQEYVAKFSHDQYGE